MYDFTLEKWRQNYIDDFLSSTDDPHLSDNLCETLPYPMDTAFAMEYIRERMFNSEERQICRAIMVDGHAVGGVDVIFSSGLFSRSAELSIWLAKPYRGQGLGGRVIKKICEDTFDNYDILRIESHPYSNHIAAAQALRTAGFKHEGTVRSAIFKNNTTYDYEIFSILKDEMK